MVRPTNTQHHRVASLIAVLVVIGIASLAWFQPTTLSDLNQFATFALMIGVTYLACKRSVRDWFFQLDRPLQVAAALVIFCVALLWLSNVPDFISSFWQGLRDGNASLQDGFNRGFNGH